MNSPSLSLRDDLLCQNDYIILFQTNAICSESFDNNIRQVVAVAD